MTSIREAVKRMLQSARPLPAGMYHYQAAPEDPRNYRLHLRIEPDGSGLLVVNASTVLHLNGTASEYAYHLLHQTTEELTAQTIARRYRVKKSQALQDFRDFKERINILIDRQDLDPEIFLEMEPTQATSSTAPLRLDCALTAQQPVNQDHLFYPAPTSSVEITLQAWQQIIDKAWEFGIPHILFTGGEPTLRDDLLALIQHAEQNGQVVGLVSDGFRMIEPAYFDEILRSGLDHVIQLIQPQNELAWQSLVKMEEADLFITAHLTITPSNKTQIKEALIKAASIGVNAFSLSSSDTSVLDTMLSMREIAANMDIPLVSGLPVPFAEMDLHSLEPEAAEKHPRSNWLYADPSGTLYLRPQDTTKIADLQNEVWPEIWERISRL